jgi:hypothetical protein
MKDYMERNQLPSSASLPDYTASLRNHDVQFQLSLLRLMYPGSDPSPQAMQLQKLGESGALWPVAQ